MQKYIFLILVLFTPSPYYCILLLPSIVYSVESLIASFFAPPPPPPHGPCAGVGGVFTAEDAYRKIRSGASLVQVYSSVALEGPALVPEIVGGLARLVAADGFSSVGEAVGADHRVVGANARSPRAS